KQPIQVREHAIVPVGGGIDAIDEIGSGKVEPFFRDLWVFEFEEVLRFFAKQLRDRCHNIPFQFQLKNTPNVVSYLYIAGFSIPIFPSFVDEASLAARRAKSARLRDERAAIARCGFQIS